VVVADLQPVQLHDQFPVDEQLFILGAAMTAGGAQHLLVPEAGSLDVSHRDEWLRPHRGKALFGHDSMLPSALTLGLVRMGTRIQIHEGDGGRR
jgi:hypothetical protein